MGGLGTYMTFYDIFYHLLDIDENCVIAALEYVGPIPYDILKPVLECCTATQLYTLEDFNPVSLFS